jgi:hypothetical protein
MCWALKLEKETMRLRCHLGRRRGNARATPYLDILHSRNHNFTALYLECILRTLPSASYMPPERTPKRVRQACEPCRSVNFSAHITHEYGAVKVRIQLQKPLDVKAGQAINLWMWMPSVSFWSFLQSHPFVVISWAEKPQDHLDLFIEPRRGLTRELLYHAKSGHTMNPWVLFNGPYGKSIPIEDCENILIVASGFGIVAHLLYLKQLIHGYNAHEVRARRIHLVWQVQDIGKS